jgi:intracellular sulfur oxidation DsrE/DsrF family protein
MKKLYLLSAVLLLFFTAFSQKDYKVVFDVTSRDSLVHRNVIRWVNEIINAEPTAQVEVVLYGKSVGMVTKDQSTVADALKDLTQKKNVSFKVCKVALKNNGVDMSQLLPGIGTVPDGIYEIISKQRDGWGYIKAQ